MSNGQYAGDIVKATAMNFNILPPDTTLEAARIRFSILRQIGLEGRAKMAIELSDGLRTVIEAGVRQRHPEYDDNMVRLAANRLESRPHYS